MKEFSTKAVWAFKPAKEVLGEKFKIAVSKNKFYSETIDQHMHAKALIMKRVDIIISDKNIFMQLLNEHDPNFSSKNIQFTDFTPVTPRNVKFHSNELNLVSYFSIHKIVVSIFSVKGFSTHKLGPNIKGLQ